MTLPPHLIGHGVVVVASLPRRMCGFQAVANPLPKALGSEIALLVQVGT
jgi:hypothetical protein